MEYVTDGGKQLLERVRELADAEDLPLGDAVAKFTVVQVQREGADGKGWQWHPWLGFTADK